MIRSVKIILYKWILPLDLLLSTRTPLTCSIHSLGKARPVSEVGPKQDKGR